MSKPEFPTVDEWCDVLGRSMDDPVVLQVRNRIGECEEAESSSGPCWSFNRQGVEINFRRQMGNAMESVDMYGSGAEWSFLKYRGELPAGLKFRMHYEDVLERVGPAVHRNRWGDEFHPFGQFVIMLSYDDETWKLNKVTLMLAAMAAELGARLEVPVRSGATEPEGGTVQAVDTKAVEVDAAQLVSLLGSAITDARVLNSVSAFQIVSNGTRLRVSAGVSWKPWLAVPDSSCRSTPCGTTASRS